MGQPAHQSSSLVTVPSFFVTVPSFSSSPPAGVGPAPVPVYKLNAHHLTSALKALRSSHAMAAAHAAGRALRAHDGVHAATSHIYRCGGRRDEACGCIQALAHLNADMYSWDQYSDMLHVTVWMVATTGFSRLVLHGL